MNKTLFLILGFIGILFLSYYFFKKEAEIMPAELQEIYNKRTTELITHWNLKCSPYISNPKPIRYEDLRGFELGSTISEEGIITYDFDYAKNNKDTMISTTIPHELSHIIVYKKYGKVESHGAQFQIVNAFMTNVIKQCP